MHEQKRVLRLYMCVSFPIVQSFCSMSACLVVSRARENRGQRERLLLTIPLVSALLVLVFGDDVLEELVDGPADGGGGHLVYDPGLYAFEVCRQAAKPIDSPEGVAEARDVSFSLADGVDSQTLLRVEQGLANVQRGGGGGCDGSRQSAGHHVGRGVVMSLGIEQLLQVFVGHEVQSLERHVHGELRGVTAVKGQPPLPLPHAAHAVQNATVWRIVHLHPLLHH